MPTVCLHFFQGLGYLVDQTEAGPSRQEFTSGGEDRCYINTYKTNTDPEGKEQGHLLQTGGYKGALGGVVSRLRPGRWEWTSHPELR